MGGGDITPLHIRNLPEPLLLIRGGVNGSRMESIEFIQNILSILRLLHSASQDVIRLIVSNVILF